MDYDREVRGLLEEIKRNQPGIFDLIYTDIRRIKIGSIEKLVIERPFWNKNILRLCHLIALDKKNIKFSSEKFFHECTVMILRSVSAKIDSSEDGKPLIELDDERQERIRQRYDNLAKSIGCDVYDRFVHDILFREWGDYAFYGKDSFEKIFIPAAAILCETGDFKEAAEAFQAEATKCWPKLAMPKDAECEKDAESVKLARTNIRLASRVLDKDSPSLPEDQKNFIDLVIYYYYICSEQCGRKYTGNCKDPYNAGPYSSYPAHYTAVCHALAQLCSSIDAGRAG